jgi:hypothetical protein
MFPSYLPMPIFCSSLKDCANFTFQNYSGNSQYTRLFLFKDKDSLYESCSIPDANVHQCCFY